MRVCIVVTTEEFVFSSMPNEVNPNGVNAVTRPSGNTLGVWSIAGSEVEMILNSGFYRYTISGDRLINGTRETNTNPESSTVAAPDCILVQGFGL